MIDQNQMIRYGNQFINIWHYLGEGYIAYSLAFADVPTEFLPLWAFIDSSLQLFDFFNSIFPDFSSSGLRTYSGIYLSQKTLIPSLSQFLIIIGEAVMGMTGFEMIARAKEKNIASDYNYISLMFYITFASKAALDLISSIVELWNLKNNNYSPNISVEVTKQFHTKCSKLLSSICELAGWTALACGNPQGWVGLAAAVTIKVAQMSYTQVSIHGLFGIKHQPTPKGPGPDVPPNDRIKVHYTKC